MVTNRQFYLASHDYVSSPEPRKCQLEKILGTDDGKSVYYVKIEPSLPGTLAKIETPIQSLYLVSCSRGATLHDIGKDGFFVDIFFDAKHAEREVLNTRWLYKIGIGSLHGSYEAAAKNAPLSD